MEHDADDYEKPRKRGKSPNKIGEEILAKRAEALGMEIGGDEPVLPFLEDANGRMFAYNGRFWEEISESTLLAGVLAHHPNSRHGFRREVIAWLRAECHRRSVRWGRTADYEVPCQNGVVDVRSGELRKHDPADYLETVIPWPYERDAPAPLLGRVLDDNFPDPEDERRGALQQFFGYIVLPHAKAKKALFLHGDHDLGKSLYAMLARDLVGHDFSCSLAVGDMEDPVKRAVLIGKRLNILTELPAEALIADGGFKTLVSTEEPILVNPKYSPAFTYVPAAKHIIVSNSLPRINDKTEATISRLLIIHFTEKLKTMDRALLDKMRAEMPGVLAWAIEGAERLVHSGFEWPALQTASAVLEELREAANPIRQFVEETMIAEGGAAVPLSEVTAKFNKWKSGGKGQSVHAVGKALRKAFGAEATGKAWLGSDGKRTAACFLGWKFASVGDLVGGATWHTQGGADGDGGPGVYERGDAPA